MSPTKRLTLLMLFLRHLHPFLSPEPFYPLVIDRPASFAKRIVNPRAAKPRPLASNPPHLLQQLRLVRRTTFGVTLRPTGLSQYLAGTTL